MRAGLVIAALAAGFVSAVAGISVGSTPARAQGLQYFYCFAPDPASGTTYVSDVHPVGALHERARYPRMFEDFLRIRGKLGVDRKAYCTMRATMREINQGRMAMRATPCRECAGAERLDDVVWPRPDKLRVPSMKVATGSRPTPTALADADTPRPAALPPEQQGAYLLAREDSVDVVAAINVADGLTEVQAKAKSRGGKWRDLMTDDRCPGWIAVAYAEKTREHAYFAVRGQDSESAASAAALDLADRWDQIPDEKKGVVFTALNRIEQPEKTLADHLPDFDSGFINGIKHYIRRMVVSPCAAGVPTRAGGGGGVRG